MKLREGSVLGRMVVWVDRWWLALAGVAFIIGSDYKFRTRAPGEALGGGIDIGVMFELFLYVLVGGYLVVARFRIPKVRRVPAPLYFLGCFVGVLLLSISYAPFPQYAIARGIQVVALFAVVVVACMDADRAAFHRLAHVYAVLIAGSVLFGLAVPAAPLNKLQAGRFTWLSIHPTVSGVMTCLATVIVASYLITRDRSRPGPRWPTPVYTVLLLIVGGGALGAQTRGAIIGGIAGILVVVLTSRGARAAVETMICLVVAGVGVALAAGPAITSYFERGEDPSKLASLNSRTDLWDLAGKAIEQNPLFGHGVTASRGIFLSDIGLGGGHNAVVNLLVEVGLLGLLVWAATVISLVRGVHRLPTEGFDDVSVDRSMILGIVTFLMLDAIFFEGPGAVSNVASTWFFLCVGWYVVAYRSIRTDLTPASIPEHHRPPSEVT